MARAWPASDRQHDRVMRQQRAGVAVYMGAKAPPYRALAVDEQEAYEMVDAGEKVRAALADKGIAPR